MFHLYYLQLSLLLLLKPLEDISNIKKEPLFSSLDMQSPSAVEVDVYVYRGYLF